MTWICIEEGIEKDLTRFPPTSLFREKNERDTERETTNGQIKRQEKEEREK